MNLSYTGDTFHKLGNIFQYLSEVLKDNSITGNLEASDSARYDSAISTLQHNQKIILKTLNEQFFFIENTDSKI